MSDPKTAAICTCRWVDPAALARDPECPSHGPDILHRIDLIRSRIDAQYTLDGTPRLDLMLEDLEAVFDAFSRHVGRDRGWAGSVNFDNYTDVIKICGAFRLGRPRERFTMKRSDLVDKLKASGLQPDGEVAHG